jgi:hypothetical protein
MKLLIHVYYSLLFVILPLHVHAILLLFANQEGGRRGCDRMAVVFITTCAISAYHH